MPGQSQTWIVMLRDVSASVQVEGEPVVVASLVLEAETGLVLGVRVASGGPDALAQALETALTEPPGTLPASTPGLLICARAIATDVETALARLMPSGALPPIRETAPVAGAEDVFDSFLGHLAGRRQPEEPPEPEDWSMAFEAARRYREQAPWDRWSDAVHLLLELDGPDGPARYLCVVLGAEGIQRGLVLYPGTELPATLGHSGPDGPVRPPVGTLMLFLDPPSELPAEVAAKALRYGWPADDELLPAFLGITADGPAEASRRDVQHLSVAAAAVTAHDQRGPIVVGSTSTTTGELALRGGLRATFSLAVSTGHAGYDRDAEVHEDETTADQSGGHAVTPATIDTLFAAFLADQRDRLARRTWRKYETIIELLADCLNGYGHQSLDAVERRRWEAAYEEDENAFVRLFGADKIVDNLGEFLGYFMIRKVAAGEELLRAAGTVTKKLAKWLAEHGHLDADDADVATERGADATRELPRAERLSRLLFEHAHRSPLDVRDLDYDDYLEDYLTIDRVQPGQLWFEGGFGPVEVPEAASALAQPGWSLSVVLARRGGRWQLVEVGNVYP
ncbi:MAG: hypothetical protein ACRDYZ_03150 [Acidimicrobiales bacterium]